MFWYMYIWLQYVNLTTSYDYDNINVKVIFEGVLLSCFLKSTTPLKVKFFESDFRLKNNVLSPV